MRALYGGPQWTPEELAKMPFTHSGTVTGRMSGGPAVINQLRKKPAIIALDSIDIELLNPLRQSTQYQRILDRRDALDRFIYHATRGLQEKLAGDDVRGMFHLQVSERYRDKYHFTEEEINARTEETSGYVQGNTGG